VVGQAVNDAAYLAPPIAENTGRFPPGSSPPLHPWQVSASTSCLSYCTAELGRK
jgi:hypothetical protein